MKQRIAVRISIYIGILVILLSVGLGVYVYVQSTAAVKGEVEDALKIHAEQAAKYIELKLENQFTALEAIAARSEIRSMEWSQQQPVLMTEISRLGNFETLGIFDLNKSGRVHTGVPLDGSKLSYLPEVYQGKRTVSELLISQLTNQPIIVFAVPIKDNNRTIGVLMGSFDASALSDITEGIAFGESGSAYVIDIAGNIIAHADRELVINKTNVFVHEESLPVGNALQELGIGNSGLISYEFQGTRKIGYVQFMPSTGWMVLTVATESEVLDGVHTLRTSLILMTIVFGVIGAILGVIIARQIAKQLQSIKEVIENVAEGDLTQKATITYNDEVGAVAAALNKTVENVKAALNRTAEASSQVNETSLSLASMAEEVSAAIEEIASTTNQFSSTIENMNQNAQSMNSQVEAIFEQASNGNKAIQEITTQVAMLRDNAKRMSDEIVELGNLSEQIGNIARMIDDIANQTNLLALNAAIEAARAGEHGRGFAVVADEVRKLAEQSSQATTEIDGLIKKVQAGINSAVKDMNDNYRVTSSAMESVEQSNTVLTTILKDVESIATQIEAITSSLEELSAGGQQIASSTEEQAGTIQQVASAAQALTEMANKLIESIKLFKLQ